MRAWFCFSRLQSFHIISCDVVWTQALECLITQGEERFFMLFNFLSLEEPKTYYEFDLLISSYLFSIVFIRI